MGVSKLQRQIGNLIRFDFSRFTIRENIRPLWLISERGERLELDFYIPELSIAFEVQGEQHFQFTALFHASESDYFAQVRRDAAKRELCIKNGVDLFEVCSADEYRLLKDKIDSSIKERDKGRLVDFILKQVAQELIDNGRMQNSINALRAELADTPRNGVNQRRLQKPLANLERSNIEIRRLSIKAIGEFYGRVILRGMDRFWVWKRERYEKAKTDPAFLESRPQFEKRQYRLKKTRKATTRRRQKFTRALKSKRAGGEQ